MHIAVGGNDLFVRGQVIFVVAPAVIALETLIDVTVGISAVEDTNGVDLGLIGLLGDLGVGNGAVGHGVLEVVRIVGGGVAVGEHDDHALALCALDGMILEDVVGHLNAVLGIGVAAVREIVDGGGDGGAVRLDQRSSIVRLGQAGPAIKLRIPTVIFTGFRRNAVPSPHGAAIAPLIPAGIVGHSTKTDVAFIIICFGFIQISRIDLSKTFVVAQLTVHKQTGIFPVTVLAVAGEADDGNAVLNMVILCVVVDRLDEVPHGGLQIAQISALHGSGLVEDQHDVQRDGTGVGLHRTGDPRFQRDGVLAVGGVVLGGLDQFRAGSFGAFLPVCDHRRRSVRLGPGGQRAHGEYADGHDDCQQGRQPSLPCFLLHSFHNLLRVSQSIPPFRRGLRSGSSR